MALVLLRVIDRRGKCVYSYVCPCVRTSYVCMYARTSYVCAYCVRACAGSMTYVLCPEYSTQLVKYFVFITEEESSYSEKIIYSGLISPKKFQISGTKLIKLALIFPRTKRIGS